MRIVVFSLSIAVSALLCAPSQAQAPDQAAITERIARDLFNVCETPAASLAEAAAAVKRLDAGYERMGDGFYAEVLARGEMVRFAPNTRQAWRARYGEEAQVVGETRSGLGLVPVMAEFMLLRVDSARLRELVRERYGEPFGSQGFAGKMTLESFRQKAPQATPIRLIYDPADATAVPRLVCGLPPPSPALDHAAKPQPVAARELAEEIWSVCGVQAPELDWYAQVIGLFPTRYLRATKALETEYYSDRELDKARSEAGLTVTDRALWARLLGADIALFLELHEQVQNGAHAFVATFRFDRAFAPAMLKAIQERFGPRDEAASPNPQAAMKVRVAMFGARSPREPGSRSILYVEAGGSIDQIVCSMGRAP